MNDCQNLSEAASTNSEKGPVYRPQFYTSEDEQGATLRVAIPGVRKEDLNLTLHEANLKIEALRSGGGRSQYALDLKLGRRFDGTGTTATLEAGILTLKVPLREESKPRQIVVN